MVLTPLQLDQLSRSLRYGEYNVLIGAAASLGSKSGEGKLLPLADEFRRELCTAKGARDSTSLQRVYSTLIDPEVDNLVTKRFSKCAPGPTLRSLPKFTWKRIFTLNIDDALEAAYSSEDSYQTPKLFNFVDPYEDLTDKSQVPIVHLHGWVDRPQDGYVFSRAAYVQMMKSQNPWMVVLTQLLATEPFIIIGSSLDEVDIDYYLSERSRSSYRIDRGPSILVEPYGDAVTVADCDRFGLALFDGTAENFMDYLLGTVLERPRPLELIPENERELFRSSASTSALSTFFSDFSAVPAAVAPAPEDPRFFYGFPPNWSDLALERDVSRAVTARLQSEIDKCLWDARCPPSVVYLSDDAATGKSTILARIAFDYARKGAAVLWCSAIARINSKLTPAMLDLIDKPCLVVVDNLADQVLAIADTIASLERGQIVFLVAERSYRQRYVEQALGGIDYQGVYGLPMTRTEAEKLVANYEKVGLLAVRYAARDQARFVREISSDPIAVACCRILNDFRSLDHIIKTIQLDVTAEDLSRYTVASLSGECIAAGIRYDIMTLVVGGKGALDQFDPAFPLPLRFSDTGRNYVVPSNRTIGRRVLVQARETAPEELLETFISIAKRLAPRVNRDAIKRRSPEARLAGRLLDFDSIVQVYLEDRAGALYEEIQNEWGWNSRYWEQRALYQLSLFQSNRGSTSAYDNLDLAVRYARHANAVENHPMTLTTLAKILFTEMKEVSSGQAPLFREAADSLAEAIHVEKRRRRSTIQPFVVYFHGVRDYLDLGGELTDAQSATLEDLLSEASARFGKSGELRQLIEDLSY